MERDDELESVIAEILQHESRGEKTRRAEWIDRHPHLATDLAEFFANHDRLKSAVDTTWGVGGSTDADLLTTPPLFDDYEILSEIERGGMGIVYRARQKSLSRIVALKTIRSGLFANEDEIRRFRREARAAAALQHPGIIPVYEVGESHGIHFFSMPLIDGSSLADVVKSGGLEPREAARLVLLIAEAVNYAHNHGIIHRDLKPANILIDSSGQPRITDFGLAKSFGEGPELTHSGQILGTPSYMAPEQSFAAQGSTTLVDVYGLGAILYALCTGHAPFEAADAVDVLLRLRNAEPILPRQHNKSIPPALQQICLRCLEKKPEHRYTSAAAVAEDLRRFLTGNPLAAAPVRPWHAAVRVARRHPVLTAHAITIISMSIILTITYIAIGTDVIYYRNFMALLAGWLTASFLFNKLSVRAPEWNTVTGCAWALADSSVLTAALVMAEPPRGPLLIGYPLMVALSALFIRVRFVIFMTIVSSCSFVLFVILTPEDSVHPHYAAFFIAGLAAIGTVLGCLVAYLRRLIQYLEAPPR